MYMQQIDQVSTIILWFINLSNQVKYVASVLSLLLHPLFSNLISVLYLVLFLSFLFLFSVYDQNLVLLL